MICIIPLWERIIRKSKVSRREETNRRLGRFQWWSTAVSVIVETLRSPGQQRQSGKKDSQRKLDGENQQVSSKTRFDRRLFRGEKSRVYISRRGKRRQLSMNFEKVVDLGSPPDGLKRKLFSTRRERFTMGEAASALKEDALRSRERGVIERQPAT